MAEVAGLVFGLPGAVKICTELGNALVKTYQSYRNADKEMREWLLVLKRCNLKIDIECEILQNLWQTLTGNMQVATKLDLAVLETKLTAALRAHNALLPESSSTSHGMRLLQKFEFVILKPSMQKAVEDVLQWSRDFDSVFYLVSFVPATAVDRQIASLGHYAAEVDAKAENSDIFANLKWFRDIHLRPDDHQPRHRSFISAVQLTSKWTDIPTSAVIKTQLTTSNGQRMIDVIMNVRRLNDEAMNRVERDVQQIAEDLGRADPSQGLLKCLGVVKRTAGNGMRFGGFDMLFEIPQGLTKPQSLRHLLCGPVSSQTSGPAFAQTSVKSNAPRPGTESVLEKRDQFSINQRLHLARQLSRSVMMLHHLGFVHKNISPYSTILLEENTGRLTPFLLGFDKFRHNQQETNRTGDDDWWRNLYRHPERQGNQSIQRFIMQHDIYSLGVCLVEIGLWTSFVLNESGAPKEGPMLEPFKLLEIKDLDKRARVAYNR